MKASVHQMAVFKIERKAGLLYPTRQVNAGEEARRRMVSAPTMTARKTLKMPLRHITLKTESIRSSKVNMTRAQFRRMIERELLREAAITSDEKTVMSTLAHRLKTNKDNPEQRKIAWKKLSDQLKPYMEGGDKYDSVNDRFIDLIDTALDRYGEPGGMDKSEETEKVELGQFEGSPKDPYSYNFDQKGTATKGVLRAFAVTKDDKPYERAKRSFTVPKKNALYPEMMKDTNVQAVMAKVGKKPAKDEEKKSDSEAEPQQSFEPVPSKSTVELAGVTWTKRVDHKGRGERWTSTGDAEVEIDGESYKGVLIDDGNNVFVRIPGQEQKYTKYEESPAQLGDSEFPIFDEIEEEARLQDSLGSPPLTESLSRSTLRDIIQREMGRAFGTRRMTRRHLRGVIGEEINRAKRFHRAMLREETAFDRAKRRSEEEEDEEVYYFSPKDDLVHTLVNGVVTQSKKAPVGTKAHKRSAGHGDNSINFG